MKYLKIYEGKWIDKYKSYTDDLLESLLSQNKEIDIDTVKDIMLEVFDEIGYYLEPTISIYFSRKKVGGSKGIDHWDRRITIGDEYDPEDELIAKNDYISDMRFLSTEEYDDPILNIAFNTWSLYKDMDHNYNNWDKKNIIIVNKLKDPKVSEAIRECYQRLKSLGYEQGTTEKTDILGVYRKVKYVHQENLDKYSDQIPDKIIKDFHKFVVRKKLSENDIDVLMKIFKKGYE